jgi:hypothetical protein
MFDKLEPEMLWTLATPFSKEVEQLLPPLALEPLEKVAAKWISERK